MRGSLGAAAILALASFAGCMRAPRSEVRAEATPKGAACRLAAASCDGPLATYAHDVRPILERRCFKCHAGDGVAADEHDFSHIETLRRQRGALVSEIGACAMPPAGEPELPEAEAKVLLRWATCGGL